MNGQGENLGKRKLAPPEGRASARLHAHRERKHPVHLTPSERHNRSIIIFATVCSAQRRMILASVSTHDAVVRGWGLVDRRLVGRYVVMPDHIHFFCAPNDLHPSSLEKWLRYWKSLVTRRLGQPGGTFWQRDHWDRQLRRGESYDGKWEYVRGNPVRHGLVAKSEDWPYQGVLHELQW